MLTAEKDRTRDHTRAESNSSLDKGIRDTKVGLKMSEILQSQLRAPHDGPVRSPCSSASRRVTAHSRVRARTLAERISSERAGVVEAGAADEDDGADILRLRIRKLDCLQFPTSTSSSLSVTLSLGEIPLDKDCDINFPKGSHFERAK